MYHLYDVFSEVASPPTTAEHSTFWTRYTPFPFLHRLTMKVGHQVCRAETLTKVHRRVVKLSKTSVVYSKSHYKNIKLWTETRQDTIPQLYTALVSMEEYLSTYEEWPSLAKQRYAEWKASMGECHWLVQSAESVEDSLQGVPEVIESWYLITRDRWMEMMNNVANATVRMEEQWTLARWNILGSGPYEALAETRRLEIVKGVQARRASLCPSAFRVFEFVTSIQVQNLMLYEDLMKLEPLLNPEEEAEKEAAITSLASTTIPCWFYKSKTGGHWIEFKQFENRRLERAYQKFLNIGAENHLVAVEEGRYEVDFVAMERRPIYWSSVDPDSVLRSIWLVADSRNKQKVQPIEDAASKILEFAFGFYHTHVDAEALRVRTACMEENMMHLSDKKTHSNTTAEIHTPQAIEDQIKAATKLSIPVENHVVEFLSRTHIIQNKFLAGKTLFNTSRRRVYRGDPRVKDGNDIENWKNIMLLGGSEGGSENEEDGYEKGDDSDILKPVEHLVLVVHGMGNAMRHIDFNVVQLRSIVQCADNLREMHQDAVKKCDFFDSIEASQNGRVEFLPIEWHTKLHAAGPDSEIEAVTLPAISKLREFTNETILDVLLFMSPTFHQVIINEVTNEINRVVALFSEKNGSRFSGKVSLVAHSLGAIISFDILSNQECSDQTRCSTSIESVGALSSVVYARTVYPPLNFDIQNCFALGSPIGMFIKVRGQHLDREYSFPSCKYFYNIFHPYDPVAYRVEPLINASRRHQKPQLLPTFEGRMRYQYQVKLAVKSMWRRLWSWKSRFETNVEAIVEQTGILCNDEDARPLINTASLDADGFHTTLDFVSVPNDSQESNPYGGLCQGGPVDFSLQENEIEIANEYLFALTAHVIYWTNRDCSLFMAKQMYKLENEPESA